MPKDDLRDRCSTLIRMTLIIPYLQHNRCAYVLPSVVSSGADVRLFQPRKRSLFRLRNPFYLSVGFEKLYCLYILKQNFKLVKCYLLFYLQLSILAYGTVKTFKVR